MQKRLTEAAVSRISPDPQRRLEIHDLAVSGLRLRISPSGRKSWSLMYKVAGEAVDGGRGKNQRMTLGQYPLIDLKAARAQAENAKALADRGIDPASQSKLEIQQRAQRRFEAVLPRFIELHAKPHTKKWRDTRKLLWTTAGRIWEGVEITSITRADVHGLLDEISRNDGSPKAREVRKHLSVFFNWAVDRGICPFNPIAGMKRKDLRYVSRDRVLSLTEMRTLWTAAEALGYPFGPIVQLLILSGQRRSEIAGIRRPWIQDDFVELPVDQYKTGVPHVLPMTQKIRAILEAQPTWNAGDFLFSTTGGRTPSSGFSRVKRRLDKSTGLENWTIHDIRRSVATHMAQSGVIQEHIERVLGHVIPGVAGTYNRYSYLDEKRAALEKWGSILDVAPVLRDSENDHSLHAR